MSTAATRRTVRRRSIPLENAVQGQVDLPDPSPAGLPERSAHLARSCLDALHAIIAELPAKKR
jgi:hypothetical protein